MKQSTLVLLATVALCGLVSGPALACTGVPDLDLSIVAQAFEGLATLLVIPDGSGPPLTEARTADGTTVDATIHLTVITYCFGEDPVPGFPREDMWLESIGGGLASCQGGTIADANTDEDGHTQWSQPLKAGGNDQGNCRVMVNGMPVGDAAGQTLNFNSPDMDGDGAINLTDIHRFSVDYFGPYEFRADLMRDGSVNLSDLSVLARALGKSCP